MSCNKLLWKIIRIYIYITESPCSIPETIIVLQINYTFTSYKIICVSKNCFYMEDKQNNKQNRREWVWCYGAGTASQSWEQFLAWTFSGHFATLKWRESPCGLCVVFNHNKAQKKTWNTILWPVRLSMTTLCCISNEEKYIRSAC